MGWLPEELPLVQYRPESVQRAGAVFADIQRRSDDLRSRLPTNLQFLRQLHAAEARP